MAAIGLETMRAWPSRRCVIAGALALPCAASAIEQPFATLEKQSGARIGVAALDTDSGKRIAWRANERFVMCSTFKLSLAAAILAKTDKGGEQLDRLVRYGADVPIGLSLVTSKNVARGMTVAELCEAAVRVSDNGAANLLLDSLGGPEALTRFWRSIGDSVTRLDDKELKLNIPDGERNTTTPAAMLGDLNILLLGEALAPPSRAKLLGWMRATTTGVNRLRAGLPPAWQWSDKTGTNDPRYGSVNDIGIAMPSGSSPILIAAYTEHANEKILAMAGKILAEAFA
jgi:beta-lactamase class A